MTKWLSLPTWLLMRLFVDCLRLDHPWRGRRFSLADWHSRQTPLCREFDAVFWISGTAITIIAALLLRDLRLF